jgi:hypothetical protein
MRRRRLVDRQGQVMPLPVDVGIRFDPVLEDREIGSTIGALEICVLDHGEACVGLTAV